MSFVTKARRIRANCVHLRTVFSRLPTGVGYRLIGCTGNCFFLRTDLGCEEELPTLEPQTAHEQHLGLLGQSGREWLYRANLGRVDPFFHVDNPYLTAHALHIPAHRQAVLGTLDAALPLARRILAPIRHKPLQPA